MAGESEEALFVAGESAPFIPGDRVMAICRKIEQRSYRQFGERLVFTFEVIEPTDYQGTKLEMFARINPKWKMVPSSSKLFRSGCVAMGKRILKGQRVTKSMFTGKVFLCKLKKSGDGPTAFSIIEELLERLAG